MLQAIGTAGGDGACSVVAAGVLADSTGAVRRRMTGGRGYGVTVDGIGAQRALHT